MSLDGYTSYEKQLKALREAGKLTPENLIQTHLQCAMENPAEFSFGSIIEPMKLMALSRIAAAMESIAGKLR